MVSKGMARIIHGWSVLSAETDDPAAVVPIYRLVLEHPKSAPPDRTRIKSLPFRAMLSSVWFRAKAGQVVQPDRWWALWVEPSGRTLVNETSVVIDFPVGTIGEGQWMRRSNLHFERMPVLGPGLYQLRLVNRPSGTVTESPVCLPVELQFREGPGPALVLRPEVPEALRPGAPFEGERPATH